MAPDRSKRTKARTSGDGRKAGTSAKRKVDDGQDPDVARLRAHLAHPDYRPVPQRELFHEMHLEPDERPAMRKVVSAALGDGWLTKLSRQRLALTPAREVLGKLSRDSRGDGWVEPEDGGETLRVPAPQLRGTLTGDQVRVRRSARGRGARLIAVEKARERTVAGVIERRGRDLRVIPLADRIGTFALAAADRGDAEEGDVVVIRVVETPEPGRIGRAEVIERWGALDHPDVPVRLAARRYDLGLEFPPNVAKAAAALPTRIGRRARAGRERFDDPPPVTIDGETARDFDDAVAVERIGRKRYRLYVHIADVGAFVTPGSELDVEARARGTSVYFPGRVLPMLPPELSDDLCSLKPGVDRLVRSAIIDLDADGAIIKARFVPGIIRSAARLTYGQVADWLEGRAPDRTMPAKVRDMVRLSAELADVLEQRRRKRGSLEFDLPRPVLLLDVEGAVTGVTIESRNVAHRLIEQFMLTANEAVAEHLRKLEIPALYRVHDVPSAEGMDELVRTVDAFGLRWKRPRGGVKPGHLATLLSKAKDPLQHDALRALVLRAMQPARYSTLCSGHFGLASTAYCHFTSPIRRYPDLVVHRALAAAESGDVLSDPPTEDLGRLCSQRERGAERAERAVLRWRQIDYLETLKQRRFDAVVTGVAAFGAFVQLDAIGVDGLIRSEALGGEAFEHDPAHRRLVSGDGRELRLGQRLTVDVVKIDRVRRRVDLMPVGYEAAEASEAKDRPRAEALAEAPASSSSRRRRRRRGRR